MASCEEIQNEESKSEEGDESEFEPLSTSQRIIDFNSVYNKHALLIIV